MAPDPTTACEARGYHRRIGHGNSHMVLMSDYCADCAEALHHPDRDPAHREVPDDH